MELTDEEKFILKKGILEKKRDRLMQEIEELKQEQQENGTVIDEKKIEQMKRYFKDE